MKISVLERRTYIVPEIIEEDVRAAIEQQHHEVLDELLSDVDTHGGLIDISTVRAEIVDEELSLPPRRAPVDQVLLEKVRREVEAPGTRSCDGCCRS